MDCCKASDKSQRCVRKRDGKEFTLPRKFTKKHCMTKPIKGFTMKSSCTPWLECNSKSKPFKAEKKFRRSKQFKHSKRFKRVQRQFGGYAKNKNEKRSKNRPFKSKSTKNKSKPQFLYNPEDPKKSFDVYINKRPEDTIHMKYTTVNDVKNTIEKLEKLYKAKKYPHKRIWQVGMILKVRLEAMKKHKDKLYPNAKNVEERFNLALKYFQFLGERSKQPEDKRYKMVFK